MSRYSGNAIEGKARREIRRKLYVDAFKKTRELPPLNERWRWIKNRITGVAPEVESDTPKP